MIEFIEHAKQAPQELIEAAKIGANRLRQITAWGEPWIFGIPDAADAA